MEAFGRDGNIVANDTHVTISWTSLRGRLSSKNGTAFETISIKAIHEISVVPATLISNGCFQIYLDGNKESINNELDWMTKLHEGILTHGVMFELPSQFQFRALAEHIQRQIYFLGKDKLTHDFNTDLTGS